MIVGRPWQEVVEEWRAARQDIFDNTSKISEENTERWSRLSSAEHALMSMARALAGSPHMWEKRGHDTRRTKQPASV